MPSAINGRVWMLRNIWDSYTQCFVPVSKSATHKFTMLAMAIRHVLVDGCGVSATQLTSLDALAIIRIYTIYDALIGN